MESVDDTLERVSEHGGALVDALQADRRDAEVRVGELALNDVEGHTVAGHLDGVCVPQLVRREAAAHAGIGGQRPKRVAGGGA